MRLLVKICGLTRPEEVEWSLEAGADALGFVFWSHSRRAVGVEQARKLVREVPPGVMRVGVVVMPIQIDEVLRIVDLVELDAVQWHGVGQQAAIEEFRHARSHVKCILAVRMLERGNRLIPEMLPALGWADYLLLDSAEGGGSGRSWDWEKGSRLAWPVPVIVAGGLTAENVTRALECLRPAGVDVSSGVESNGLKDHAKILRFVQTVRSWECNLRRGGTDD